MNRPSAQEVPTLPTPTTLIAKVKQLKPVEEYPNMLGQRLPVSFERLDVSGLDARGPLLRRVEDQRRRVLDPRRRAQMLDEFRV